MTVQTERKNPGRVRLSFDVEEGLRRAVRMEAVRRDMTLTEFLTLAVEERLGPVKEEIKND